ncbi:MAG: hypothetical protein V2I62_07245 [Bacteroidales bacterium]|nr:hypothetical protein [Bacteroidales bacterium]
MIDPSGQFSSFIQAAAATTIVGILATTAQQSSLIGRSLAENSADSTGGKSYLSSYIDILSTLRKIYQEFIVSMISGVSDTGLSGISAANDGDPDYCTEFRKGLLEEHSKILRLSNVMDVTALKQSYNVSARKFNFLCSSGNSNLPNNNLPPVPLW